MKKTIAITCIGNRLEFPNGFDGSVHQWEGGYHQVVEADGRVRFDYGRLSREAFLAFFLTALD